MPLLPPFPFKSATVAPTILPAVHIVREPVMSLTFPAGAHGIGFLHIDQMPLMNREPQVLPDIPGGGESYAGYALEYLDMGIGPYPTVEPRWSGRGADTWTVYLDGVSVNTITNVLDGQVGPFTVGILAPADGWWNATYSISLQATYTDFPGMSDYWIDATSVGVNAFGPSQPPTCPCGFCPSIDWDKADYWNAWVIAHHNEADTGPLDRYGNPLGLTGPWGSAVAKQHLKTNPAVSLCLTVGVPDGTTFASNLFDLTERTLYSPVTYPVSDTQDVPGFRGAGNPVFNQTQGMKVGT